MLEKTFKLTTDNGTQIELTFCLRKGEGALKKKLKVSCPGGFELSVFEAKKLAKGLLDTIDVGRMI